MSARRSPSAVESVLIGPHEVEIEGNCILTRLHGPFGLDHIRQWCALADQLISAHGDLFTISDLSTGGSFPAETRHYISRWVNVVHIRGAAIFGASRVTSAVFSMIARAVALVREHTPPTMAVQTESEARAWVAELQRKQTFAHQ